MISKTFEMEFCNSQFTHFLLRYLYVVASTLFYLFKVSHVNDGSAA